MSIVEDMQSIADEAEWITVMVRKSSQTIVDPITETVNQVPTLHTGRLLPEFNENEGQNESVYSQDQKKEEMATIIFDTPVLINEGDILVIGGLEKTISIFTDISVGLQKMYLIKYQ